MPQFTGTPVTFSRFGGFADYTDPPNLPLGQSPLVKNFDFTLDSARTRNGIQTALTGANQVPIVGLLSASYTPEDVGQVYSRMLLFYDAAGLLQTEQPPGTQKVMAAQAWAGAVTVQPPAGAHMMGSATYNRAYLSFANLVPLNQQRHGFVAASSPIVVDLATRRIDPYGLRPFGERWLAGESYLVGEMVTPTNVGGNGHTYRCIQAGVSGGAEPAWPVGDSVAFADGTVQWQEHTAVLANRLPVPDAPGLALAAGGTFASGVDVYVLLTQTNPQGETTASATATVTTTAANQAVTVTPIAALPAWMAEVGAAYSPTGFNVYEASVATGQPAPTQASFHLVGVVQPGATLTIMADASSSAATPPSRNSARLTAGMLPVPVDAVPVQRSPASGGFPVGRDVYLRKTYTNSAGETPLGPSSSVVNTVLNDSVSATVEGKEGYQVLKVGIYEADVATGAAEPDKSAFALVGYFNIGETAKITASATGSKAPTVNGTGSGGLIAADSATGGINGTQGHRYAAVMFRDYQGTLSGFNFNSVIGTVVDEDGWELGIFHVATGPANVQNRVVALSVANGTDKGAFWAIEPAGLSYGVQMTATVLYDNASPALLMDFTDDYLKDQTGNDYTYRAQTIKPHACVDLYYAPSIDRFIQSGVPGFSGHWISRAADAASYQSDEGELSTGTQDDRVICAREFRETIYSLRERSGYTITPSTDKPNAWGASRRWSKVGVCGARAVDVGKEVMVFVHRSGIYAYDGNGDPRNVSDELPDNFRKFWKSVNWLYGETVWVALDEERKVVRIGLPIEGSTSPNVELALWYVRGWARGGGQEDGDGRCFSVNDISANLGARIERDLNYPVDGDAAYSTTQFLYASAGPDGTLQAIVPGQYDDNGTGIDCVYETGSADEMLHVSQVEGYNLSVYGEGEMNVSLISRRVKKNPNGPQEDPGRVIDLRSVPLDPYDSGVVSRYCPGKLGTQWRMRFTNGKQAGYWMELKRLEVYMQPYFSAE